VTTPTLLLEAWPDLAVADRCDACGAQAFAISRHANGFLLWCGHHFANNEPALLLAGADVDDQRERINRKPSQSSA
jgi:hypothetical protein